VLFQFFRFSSGVFGYEDFSFSELESLFSVYSLAANDYHRYQTVYSKKENRHIFAIRDMAALFSKRPLYFDGFISPERTIFDADLV
jgi:hypothetical protein